MKTPIIVSLLLAVAAPLMAAPDAAFDQGVDVSALAAKAKDAARRDETVVSATGMGGTRYDVDCADIVFHAADKDASEAVRLRSQEWVTECTPAGDPRRGGGQTCWDRPGMSWSRSVQVTRQNHLQLLPWEHDVFRVCLQGPWLDVSAVETAYDYKLTSSGSADGNIVLSAGRKTAQSPDPTGVLADLDAQLRLSLSDKWASYYGGEKVTLKIELKKVVKFWPDATVLQKEVTVPVAASYALDLGHALAELLKPEAGQEYYVRYSIRRVGSVSKDAFTKTLETGRVLYAPATVVLN